MKNKTLQNTLSYLYYLFKFKPTLFFIPPVNYTIPATWRVEMLKKKSKLMGVFFACYESLQR